MGIKERIEALQPDCQYDCDWQDLRNRAAKEAAEADELMAEMAGTIANLQSWITDGGYEDTVEYVAEMCGEARSVMDKYDQYKNQTNGRR